MSDPDGVEMTNDSQNFKIGYMRANTAVNHCPSDVAFDVWLSKAENRPLLSDPTEVKAGYAARTREVCETANLTIPDWANDSRLAGFPIERIEKGIAAEQAAMDALLHRLRRPVEQ